MSTALATTETSYSEQWRYAQALAQAGLLPKQYRDSPGDVLLAMAYADALGLRLAQVFTGIHVIEGRPSMSAELMSALVRRAGHRIRMQGDKTSATAELVRLDDPDFTYRSTFTIEDAKTAGLLGKDVWKKYPDKMLLARAVSAVARAGASDVLAGVSYVPEELGDQPEIVDAQRISIDGLSSLDAKVAQSMARTKAELAAEEPPEAPKRRRRTKAEIEEARRAEEELAGPSDPAGEEQQEQAVAEANTEEWVNTWLLNLDAAVDAKDRAAIGVLGSKAAAGNRRDLVAQARDAWNKLQAES